MRSSLVWALLIVVGGSPSVARADSQHKAVRLRRPVALVPATDSSWLYVANRRSGSVSAVNVDQKKVIHETDVCGLASDMVAVPGTNLLLLADEQNHELIVLATDGPAVNTKQRLSVSPYPVSLAIDPQSRRVLVASLWSRRITSVKLNVKDDQPAAVDWVLDLPFSPRQQLLVREATRLVVADAFAGRLAIVDPANGQLLAQREFPGHNIRGLGVNPDESMLVIAHQMLNDLAHTVRNDVHWGLLMSNDLRWLPLDSVMDSEADLYRGAHMHPLGEAGRATGDPSGLTVGADGQVVVALGGVGEIAVGEEDDFSLQRIRVGKRPTDVEIHSNGREVYVANTFDDSVSIVDLENKKVTATISLGQQQELSVVDRGELLFFDARLSHDSWMSCHSCHTDGHTNGMLNDNFSDGSFGAPKRVLSLLGRGPTAPFAWNGTAPDLHAQIAKSIELTMQSDNPPKDDEVQAIAAFVETLSLPPSVDRLRGVHDDAAIERGMQVFEARRCSRCHTPPHYTSPNTYSVGLEDELGNNEFNPPPLKGVNQRNVLFHDGRAKSLEEVLAKFQHQLMSPLSDKERADLIAFLRSL